MATTRIMPLHIGKGRTESRAISDIIDYVANPQKTDNGKLIGILTAQDIVEAVDDELGEDYAKLAGLTAEEDLHEKTSTSIKKRLPWLIILLFLGMAVSSVVGVFETVVAVLPIVMCFQIGRASCRERV